MRCSSRASRVDGPHRPASTTPTRRDSPFSTLSTPRTWAVLASPAGSVADRLPFSFLTTSDGSSMILRMIGVRRCFVEGGRKIARNAWNVRNDWSGNRQPLHPVSKAVGVGKDDVRAGFCFRSPNYTCSENKYRSVLNFCRGNFGDPSGRLFAA